VTTSASHGQGTALRCADKKVGAVGNRALQSLILAQ